MKLSAPPPPPPEPNEAGLPAPEQPAGTVAPETPEASPPVPPVESKQATWPVWFSGADFVLAAFAVVLAFFAASFVARNSDIFLHLATGQRLLAGTYTPGSDPFSFSAADRPWVNHSLLFDVGAYLLYSGNGATLGVIKAIAIAAAFALVIGIRRPGFSLWPWAVVAAIGVVAAAPYLHLRPTAGSILLLAVTLFLLFRVPHRPGSWRFPIAIGVTFWVWSNTDEWFFLGPMALALVLIGELIQRAMRKPEPATDGQPASAPAEEDPVGLPPDVSTLARALGIGLLVCMLNPNHVRVWQLPFELVGDRQMTEDIRFKQLLVTPLERDYTDKAHLGYNQNGLAFALLFVGGGTALGLGASRVRFAHIALWVGFALLVLCTVQAIPFLAIVAVPIIAGQLNAISSRVSLTTWGDPRTRLLLLGSAGGRVLSVIAILIACVLAWPGWIHPPTGNPAFVRRVAWGVEADPGMARGAEQLQAWRSSGQLPADAHGFQTTLEFANYCAWFAPDEKVFANGRFNHHRRELPTYLTVRKGLQLVASSELPNPKDLQSALEKSGVEYVVLHSAPGDSSYIPIPAGNGDVFLVRSPGLRAAVLQWLDPDHWSPWYIDGRSAISGWRSKPGAERLTFTALKLAPVTLAFGDKVERLQTVATQPVRPYGGWEEAFIRSAPFPPPGADDSMIWAAHRIINGQLQQEREYAIRITAALTDRFVGGVGLVSRIIPLPPPDTGLRASAFLSVRAARRAVAADPNHPDGYFALYKAMDARELPLSDSDRAIAQITALRQCLERMPPPEEFRSNVYAASPSEVAARLALMYLALRADYGNVQTGIPVNSPAFVILSARFGATGYLVGDRNRVVRKSAAALQGQQVQPLGGPYLLPLDLAREAILKAQEYIMVDAVSAEAGASSLARLKELQKLFETELAQANNAYESRRAAQKPRLPDQIQMALQANLSGEALRLMGSLSDPNVAKDFGPALLDFLLCRISLELAVGRLEDAVADLDQLATDPGIQKALNDAKLGDVFRLLMYQRYILEGNYAEAGSILESLDGKNVGLDPLKPLRDKFAPKFFVDAGDKLSVWAEYAPLAGLLAPTPFELIARIRGPGAALGGDENNPGFIPLRNELANRRSQDAEFFYQRGLLSLYEGDIPAARKRFLQTRQPAIKDWGIPEYRNGNAELYLRLIDAAEKAAPVK